MERITQNMLDRQADLINRMLNRPAKPYVNGKAQVGNFHIDSCGSNYWSFVEMVTDGGGITTIIGGCSKRDLWERMHAWRAGMDYAQRAAHEEAVNAAGGFIIGL